MKSGAVILALRSSASSHVQVRVDSTDDGTEIAIRHERLPSVAARDRYIRCWIRCFDGMERLARA